MITGNHIIILDRGKGLHLVLFIEAFIEES